MITIVFCAFWAIMILAALSICRAASKPTPHLTASGPTAPHDPTYTPAARHNNRLTASSAKLPTAEGSNTPHSRIISLNPKILS